MSEFSLSFVTVTIKSLSIGPWLSFNLFRRTVIHPRYFLPYRLRHWNVSTQIGAGWCPWTSVQSYRVDIISLSMGVGGDPTRTVYHSRVVRVVQRKTRDHTPTVTPILSKPGLGVEGPGETQSRCRNSDLVFTWGKTSLSPSHVLWLFVCNQIGVKKLLLKVYRLDIFNFGIDKNLDLKHLPFKMSVFCRRFYKYWLSRKKFTNT